MSRIRLIHWNATEAQQKASVLESMGYTVEYELNPLQALKEIKKAPPEVVVVDLSRLPSQGRDIAISIRLNKSSRATPIIFVGGETQKSLEIKKYVPDATFTSYGQIDNILKKVLANPPRITAIPKSVFEPYNQASLAKKLGIKPNSTVALIDPPKDFAKTIGELPPNVEFNEGFTGHADLTILFVETQTALLNETAKIAGHLKPTGKFWIAWRKMSSEQHEGPTQVDVRKMGLDMGLVDYKICRIDAEWTALLFTRRKPKKPENART